jgi:hypothetical protein
MQDKPTLIELWVLIVILAAALIPMFALASRISSDEWLKAAPAIVLGAVITLYKLWVRATRVKITQDPSE